jgi:microsomal epoxide hydrolase
MTMFATPPKGSVDLSSYTFKVEVPDKAIQDLKTLLDISPLPPVTYEGSLQNRKYGVTRDWLVETRDYWRHKFEWRKHEEHINTFPQFKLPIKDDDGTVYDIHFAALFSEKPDAIPLICLHGWPGPLMILSGIV